MKYRIRATIDGKVEEYLVDRQYLQIGRDPNAQVRLKHPSASKQHAMLELVGDSLFIRDVGSASGTYVNGARIARKTQLQPGDEFQVADHLFSIVEEDENVVAEATSVIQQDAVRSHAKPRLVLADQPEFTKTGASTTQIMTPTAIREELREGKETVSANPNMVIREKDGKRTTFIVTQAEFTIGRETDNHLRIRDRAISKVHCRFIKQQGLYHIFDEGSFNGVFVNGEKVDGEPLHNGDLILLGQTIIEFYDPNAPESKVDRRVAEHKTRKLLEPKKNQGEDGGGVTAPMRKLQVEVYEQPRSFLGYFLVGGVVLLIGVALILVFAMDLL